MSNWFARRFWTPRVDGSSVYSPSLLVTRLGVVLAALCGAVGVAVHGPQDGFLWSVVGYFAGKSIRSVVRTVGAGRTA